MLRCENKSRKLKIKKNKKKNQMHVSFHLISSAILILTYSLQSKYIFRIKQEQSRSNVGVVAVAATKNYIMLIDCFINDLIHFILLFFFFVLI